MDVGHRTQPGHLPFGQLTSGRDGACHRGFERIARPPDAPRAGDNRRRGSPDVRRSDRRARTGRAPRRAILPPSSARIAASSAACSRARSCGISATHDEFAFQRRRVVRLQLRDGPPSDREDLERALDALRIVRMDARRGRRVDVGQPRVQRGPPGAPASASRSARMPVVALGQLRDAADRARAGTASCRRPAAAPCRALRCRRWHAPHRARTGLPNNWRSGSTRSMR